MGKGETRMNDVAGPKRESPEYLRISLAAAITLGIKQGRFYRDARLRCINLLMSYEDGCKANCAYCGLQKRREGLYDDKSFIRVDWPSVSLGEITQRCRFRLSHVKRICLSMITHPQALSDSVEILRRLKREIPSIPLSLLCAPTLLSGRELEIYRTIPVDRLGIAVDAATEEIFHEMRGQGPEEVHRWDHYWRIFDKAIEVFGHDRVGVHLIVGLGETEEAMVRRMDRIRRAGGTTHLFCFYPEKGSRLEGRPQPPVWQYRRVQLARYLIDKDLAGFEDFSFDARGRIVSFGLPAWKLERIVMQGTPFMTSGCPDGTGETICTRPYGDCKPGEDIRSFPFKPDPRDLSRIRWELAQYDANP